MRPTMPPLLPLLLLLLTLLAGAGPAASQRSGDGDAAGTLPDAPVVSTETEPRRPAPLAAPPTGGWRTVQTVMQLVSAVVLSVAGLFLVLPVVGATVLLARVVGGALYRVASRAGPQWSTRGNG